ncbi:type IV pilus assembly protein PilM [Aeromonas bivalvium]|uniref:type IV pilus assembly protein PilM n=1 Tax=Aeromonas bivalvium TaxID=440079 RepID=UPI0038D13810
MVGLFKKGTLVPLIGVDFGSQSIKAVTLNGSAARPRLESVADVPMPKGALIDYQVQDIERVSQAIKTLKRQLIGSNQQVATAVTGSNVITKVILVDGRLSEGELEAQVQLQAEQLISYPLDEVSMDFEVLAGAPETDRQRVLLSAARTESVNGRVSALAEAELTTRVVDVGAHALVRAVLACQPDLASLEKPVAVIDIGASAMTFASLQKGEVTYFRLQNFGGDQYSQAISSFYNLPLEEAELAKVQQQLPADHEMEVLQPYLQSLLQQVRRNIQLFASSSGQRELAKLVLTGGGSLVAGLTEALRQELSLEVLHPDPFVLFGRDGDESRGHGAKYMTAFGLALRSFTPCQI